MPIWSTERVLDFVDARRACKIEEVTWQDGGLTATYVTSCPDLGITVMIPERFGRLALSSLTLNGGFVDPVSTTVAGSQYRLAVLTQPKTEMAAQYS